MAESDTTGEGPKKFDVILMRVFYIEAILFMSAATALGIYVYPTISRLMNLSLKLEKVGDIGALVDDQVARVEGKLKGVADRVSGRVDDLSGKLSGVSGRLDGQLDEVDERISGVTSRLEGQVGGVEKRIDEMLKNIEERLRNILKFKLGGTPGAGESAPGTPALTHTALQPR
jgi:hypothetical protein